MKGFRFRPEMAVAALRANNPKLETRRLINPQPTSTARPAPMDAEEPAYWAWGGEHRACDYRVGERRCLLTTWAVDSSMDEIKPTGLDTADVSLSMGLWHAGQGPKPGWAGKSRPGMFLPNRLRHLMPLLEVTSVQAERLSSITPEGARREGLSVHSKDGQLDKYGIADYDGLPGTDDLGWPWKQWDADPVAAYRTLWEKINGEGSWALNPWVFVIGFGKAP